MKIFLYCVLAAGLVFDVAAATYLWKLQAEKAHASNDNPARLFPKGHMPANNLLSGKANRPAVAKAAP